MEPILENRQIARIFISTVAWLLMGLMSLPLTYGEDLVAITVQERAGVERINEYVSFGIPLPRTWNVTNLSNLRVRNALGTPVAAQFKSLARWGASPDNPTAPVKWALVGFFTSLPANTSQGFQLDHNGPGPAPATAIQIDTATPGKMTVDTGAAQFELNTTGNFNLFQQVTIGGKALLQSLSATNAIDYEAAGSLSIVAGGSPDFTARVTAATLERQGQLNTIVKVVGSILDNSARALLDYTARLHFYAGSSDVRLDFTVENNQPILAGESGQPTNVHDQGAINSVYIGSLKLKLQLQSTGGNLRVLSEQGLDLTSPASTVRLYQDSSGTDYWNMYVGQVGWPDQKISAKPRLQSYCTTRGFQLTGPGVALRGDQALGWMAAFRPTGACMSVAVKNFWQNFPKAIETQSNGTVAIDLFPNGSQFKHNFRVGEAKTHSLLLHFGSGSMTATEAKRLAKAFNTPLFGTGPAAFYVNSGVLDEVPVADLPKWPLYERYVRVAFEPNPDFNPNVHDPGFGNSTLEDTIQKYNFYGWQDYGDVPLDYEAFGPNQAGQMNLKYWYVFGMLTQFCRSADLNWLELGLPAAWHLADIDYLHIPDEGIQHWAHGAYFGHSQHDEPGCTNPNRNYNSPATDLFFGVPDLIRAYHLSGEQRFLDTALEGLQALENLSQFSDFTYPVFYRERANLISAYIEGYRQTGDVRWLNNAKTIIGYTAITSDKGWLTNPTAYIPPPGGPSGDERISGFQFALVLWTLGRYLDFCAEYSITDTLGVASALATYGDFIINHLMRPIPEKPGYYATIDSIWFTSPYATYLEVNDWALLMADTLAYAYKYSRQKRFLDNAARLYATGTEDQTWLDDPPVYITSKDLVNSLNWGLVYMNTTPFKAARSLPGIYLPLLF